MQIVSLVVALTTYASVALAQRPTPECPYSYETCAQGYVWREAYSTYDHVCVYPQIRAQAAADNAQAASRREPNGGPYGPDTCKQGYVWREADYPFRGTRVPADDHVCVTAATRAQIADDNRNVGMVANGGRRDPKCPRLARPPPPRAPPRKA